MFGQDTAMSRIQQEAKLFIEDFKTHPKGIVLKEFELQHNLVKNQNRKIHLARHLYRIYNNSLLYGTDACLMIKDNQDIDSSDRQVGLGLSLKKKRLIFVYAKTHGISKIKPNNVKKLHYLIKNDPNVLDEIRKELEVIIDFPTNQFFKLIKKF
jgi:hypothetical protein